MAQVGYTPLSLYYSTTGSAVPVNTNLVNGELAINITDGKLYYKDNTGTVQLLASKAGASGDVVGPASATDNAVVRFDGTTGKLVQNSAVTIADTTGDITGGAYNKVTITAPASSATLTIANGKTLTANATLTLAGTDATTMTFPSTSASIARTDAGQTFTGDQVIAGNLTLNAQGDVRFADSDSSNWVAFQGAATIASNVTWTLPSADGTNGQVLSTNGSGTLSWATAGGSSQWTTSGSDIYYTTGSVSVGTTAFTGKFNVAGQSPETHLISNSNGNTYGSALRFRMSQGTSGSPTVVANNNEIMAFVAQGYDGSSFQNAASIRVQIDGTPGSSDMPGRMIFYTTPDGSATDTERMRIDSNGNVGIGTTTTTSRIYALGVGNTTGGSKQFYFDGGTNNGTASPDTMQYAMFVTQGGARYSNQCAIYAVAGASSANTNGVYASQYYGIRGDALVSSQGSQAGSGIYGYGGSSDFNYGGKQVGVEGLSRPGYTSFSNSYGASPTNGGFGGWFQAHGKADSIGLYCDAYLDASPGANQQAIPLMCGTNSSELMRLTSAGELWIGYTSDNGAYKLQVNSQIFATSATIATSDGRYKENVETLNGCLGIVKALRPVTFTWKKQESIYHPTQKEEYAVPKLDKDGNQTGEMTTATRPKLVREGHNFPSGTQVGFIAQEVQEVIKDKAWLRSIIKENARPAIIDGEGKEVAPKENFYGIAEGNMISILTSALQEAIAKIETLETRLSALENK